MTIRHQTKRGIVLAAIKRGEVLAVEEIHERVGGRLYQAPSYPAGFMVTMIDIAEALRGLYRSGDVIRVARGLYARPGIAAAVIASHQAVEEGRKKKRRSRNAGVFRREREARELYEIEPTPKHLFAYKRAKAVAAKARRERAETL